MAFSTVQRQHQPGRRLRRDGRAMLPRLGIALAGVLVLAGCKTSDYPEVQQIGSIDAFRTTDRHPISVEMGEVRLNVDLPARIRELSPRQKGEIAAFLREYTDLGEGEIVVSVPSGTANEGAAMRVLGEVRKLIGKAHIAKTAVRYSPYGGDAPGSEPPIVLGFNRYFANPSPCGYWPANVADEPLNKPYANFGCANQNNLAAMVADPRDLVRPRIMTPGDAARRQVVFEKYHQGQVTAAERSADETATVAEVKE